MSEDSLPVTGPTVSEDNVVHFDITSGPDYPLQNPPLEEVEAAQESSEALEEAK
jgi:hypothetical protein